MATMHDDIFGQEEKVSCGWLIGRIAAYAIIITMIIIPAIIIIKKGGGDPTINSVLIIIILVVAITLGVIAEMKIKDRIDEKIEEKKRKNKA